jgi:hypothetical protein
MMEQVASAKPASRRWGAVVATAFVSAHADYDNGSAAIQSLSHS